MSALGWLILVILVLAVIAMVSIVLRRRASRRRRDRHEAQAVKLLVTASQINGLPVVTVRGGEDVAEVRDVIYNPEMGRLVGLTLNKRGFFSGRLKEVLPAEAIHAIGPDAVMILDDSALTDARRRSRRRRPPGHRTQRHRRRRAHGGGQEPGSRARPRPAGGKRRRGRRLPDRETCRWPRVHPLACPAGSLRRRPSWSPTSPRSSSVTTSSASVLRSTSSGPGWG